MALRVCGGIDEARLHFCVCGESLSDCLSDVSAVVVCTRDVDDVQ
jgi:hypothetical protein